MKYPHFIDAAWGISGTLEFAEDFADYDSFLGAELNSYDSCLSKVQALTDNA